MSTNGCFYIFFAGCGGNPFLLLKKKITRRAQTSERQCCISAHTHKPRLLRINPSLSVVFSVCSQSGRWTRYRIVSTSTRLPAHRGGTRIQRTEKLVVIVTFRTGLHSLTIRSACVRKRGGGVSVASGRGGFHLLPLST